MLRHGHFEEICAAASVGQATGEELVELEQHASECGRCKQAYFNYLKIAAQQFATAKQDPTISPKAIEECIDSELFRHSDEMKRGHQVRCMRRQACVHKRMHTVIVRKGAKTDPVYGSS